MRSFILAILLLVGALIQPSYGADTLAVQQQLNRLGYDVGEPDGVVGSRTTYAIKAFQTANGMRPTGQLSSAGETLLFSMSPISASNDAPQLSGGEFEIFENIDLPYGDYRSGKEDPGLKGISLDECHAICSQEGRCNAFTYNVRYKFCFLKERALSQMPFDGAISGQRSQGASTTVNADAGSKLVGAPKGCPAQESVIERLRAEMSVSIADSPVHVGPDGKINVRWQRGAFPERLPVFLMVSLDSPVRFEGKGLYGLTPAARAAFDISQFAGTTRAVIPLFGAGAADSGEFAVVPLQEGNLAVSWDVVGMTDCGERISSAPSRQTVAVSAGAPAVVFQNVFSDGQPKERILSPSGDRSINVYSGYYRLYDKSGYLIAERGGQQPRFSLTGRFVSAWTGTTVLEVIDSVDGAKLTQQWGALALGWDNADSFYAVSQMAWSLTLFSSPLVSGSSGHAGRGCHACSGTSEGFRFDLENNYALAHDAGASLTSEFFVETDRVFDKNANKAIAELRRYSQVAPLVMPADSKNGFDWNLDTDRPLTSIHSDITWLDDQYVEPNEFLETRSAEVLRVSDVATPIVPASLPAGVTTKGAGDVAAVTAGSIAAVTERLQELEFARSTDVLEVDEPVTVLKTTEWWKTVRVAGLEEFTFVANTYASTCSADGKADALIFSPGDKVRVQKTDRFSLLLSTCAEGSANFVSASLVLADRNSPGKLVDMSGLNHEDKSNDQCEAQLGICGLDVRVFDDRFVVMWSKASDALSVYDGDRQKLVSYAALPGVDMINDVAVDKTGRWLVLYFSGDLFSLIDLSIDQSAVNNVVDPANGARPIVLRGVVADSELVVWDSNMRFDATAEGGEFVGVRFAGRSNVYALTQFDAALRRKSFLKTLAEGTQTASPPDLPGPPPVLIEAHAAAVPASGEAMVSARWTDPGITRITLLQDGLLSAVVDVDPSAGQLETRVALVPGTRWLTLVAQNAEGTFSQPYSTEVSTEDAGARSIRLLAVGVDKYDDRRLPALPLARADAGNIFATLSSATGITIGEAQIAVDDATFRSSVSAHIEAAVAATSPTDTLVLFLSGHGLSDAEGNLYFAAKDTSLDDLAGTALAWKDVAATIGKARGRVVVFLDTCHSGMAGTGYETATDGAVEDLLTAIPSNLLIFSASKGREFSQERTDLGGGVFTAALVQAIDGRRTEADVNHNGALEISELYTFVRAEVARDTNGQQTPWFARNRMIGDFAVF